MNTLPSFVELMASLGLDNHPTAAGGGSPYHHSRSSSHSSISSLHSEASSSVATPPPSAIYFNASPSILISSHDPIPNHRELERRRSPSHAARYAPYISHTRKGSASNITDEETSFDRPIRPLSTPYLSSSSHAVGRRASSWTLRTASKRPDKLTLSDTDLTANTPISTFVRRKTPQASPTSPTFSHHAKRRSCSPTLPMSIPSLPHVFPPSPTANAFDSDLEDDDMEVTPKTSSYRPKRSRQPPLPMYNDCGVRITALSRPGGLESEHSCMAPVS